MRRYIRVIPDVTIDDAVAELQSLIDANPAISEVQPPTRHPRGGFSLFLDFGDSEFEAVLQYLSKNGWRPCI